MRKIGLAVLIVLVGAAALWRWQQPQADGIAAESLLAILADQDASGYAIASEPGAIQFPRDFGPHEDYQGEWWYYTGNLETAGGRLFGYQLTFFRKALAPTAEAMIVEGSSSWRTNQIYMANFAISDIAKGGFYPVERFGRAALGMAGATAEPYGVWVGDWYARESENKSVTLSAKTQHTALELSLTQTLPPILHGNAGLSVKSEHAETASYYYSLLRQATRGTVTVNGESFSVTGVSWKDHEYFSGALAADDLGWDWFGLQFNNGAALMIYQLRRKNGEFSPFSGGTFVAGDGTVTHLSLSDWRITAHDHWTSSYSHTTYPIGWQIEIKRIGLRLTGAALIRDQEWRGTTPYWEGAASFEGHYRDGPIKGHGYVEMTGY
ncbi:hypothetical protein F0Q45_03720 [Mycobacterium simiae]|uniref:AttH domain-containing protein n=1 Tax=Mycobacterium simiae TaxID=1784 RepID=A0A5B1BVR2_MYCSI|nr:lipocalin-like domain-containing protein [Mycobacterium simiae]KAA1251550.1 hypothetical protein F0Q45_03720 [Mycobacterium simiae]